MGSMLCDDFCLLSGGEENMVEPPDEFLGVNAEYILAVRQRHIESAGVLRSAQPAEKLLGDGINAVGDSVGDRDEIHILIFFVKEKIYKSHDVIPLGMLSEDVISD